MSKTKKPIKKKDSENEFDFLEKFKANQEEINLKDPKLMKELKEMGWDENDDMDIDPELEELEKEINDEEMVPEVYHGKEMTAEEIENAKFDEDELNDPDLLAELEEAEDPEDDPVFQANKRISQLKDQIEICKQNALKEKEKNNRQAALEHLKLMKSLQVELESSEKLLSVHKISQKNSAKPSKKNDDPPPEEDFDYTSVVSIPVLEYEKERAVKRNDNDVVDSIDMQINIITNNINFGILTQEGYIKSLEDKIKEYKKALAKKEGKGTLAKHVEIMENELKEASEMEEDEEIEEPQPEIQKKEEVIEKSKVPHEVLMNNIRYKVAYESLEEGKEAFKYLKDHGKIELCEKLLPKLEKWQEIINIFQSGKDYRAEVQTLAPADVIGYSEEQRRSQFKRLLELSAKDSVVAKEMALEALRKKDKESALKYKKDMLEYEGKSKILEEALKNPWQSPPNVGVRASSKSIPCINEDLAPGVLEITYGKVTGLSDKENYLISYSLIAGDTLSGISEKFSKVCEKGINFTFAIKIDAKNIGSLYKKHVNFEVFEHHRLRSNKSQGTCSIKLDDLAKKCTVNSKISLTRKGPHIEVTFRIHKSLAVAEFKQVVEKVEYIEDLPIPFKSPQGKVIHSSGIQPVSQGPKSLIKEEEKKSQSFDDIGQDEMENPNVIRNLVSFEVLELEIERLKGVIVQLRTNGNNADRIINIQRELMKNKAIIEAQVSNGVISPLQYKEVLENQVQHDLRLAQFYKEKGKKEHLAMVVNRVKIMKKEIEELNNSE